MEVKLNLKQKSVADLKKLFENLDTALDEIPTDLGASHYKKAKKRTLTLSLKNRVNNYSDVRNVFVNKESSCNEAFMEKESTNSIPLSEEEAKAQSKLVSEIESLDVALGNNDLNIHSDKDVAEILVDVIHGVFYNPEKGFWINYDAAFDRQKFISYGKPGWDATEVLTFYSNRV